MRVIVLSSNRILAFLLLIAIFTVVLISGCVEQNNSNIKPMPSQTQGVVQPNEEFHLKYGFEENVALFHRVRVETTIDGNKQTQIMETVTIPKEVHPDYAHIRVIMLKAVALDNNTKDLCGNIAYGSKLSDANLYIDGKVDYGWTSTTSFYMPQRALHIGDSWSFEGVTYNIKKASKLNTPAGSFDVLEIEFSGKRTNSQGTRNVKGTLYFDYKNNRIAKYVQEESAFAYERKIEQELIDVKKDYGEPDMHCVLEMNLSTVQKYERAKQHNAVENFNESLIFALSAKQDFEGKELNAEERKLYIKILEILADDYKGIGERTKLLSTRFELGKLYSSIYLEELSSGNINARDYFAAAYNLEFVSNSESADAEEAKAMLAKLKSSELAIARGRAILQDKGDNTGMVAELYDMKKTVRFELLGEPYYNVPLLDVNAASPVAIYFYNAGYRPKFIVMSASELISKDRDIILEPHDENVGIVAGTCYGTDGFVQGVKLLFKSAAETKEVDCNRFYVAELAPGNYSVLLGEKTIYSDIQIDANSTVIKHIMLSESS